MVSMSLQCYANYDENLTAKTRHIRGYESVVISPNHSPFKTTVFKTNEPVIIIQYVPSHCAWTWSATLSSSVSWLSTCSKVSNKYNRYSWRPYNSQSVSLFIRIWRSVSLSLRQVSVLLAWSQLQCCLYPCLSVWREHLTWHFKLLNPVAKQTPWI